MAIDESGNKNSEENTETDQLSREFPIVLSPEEIGRGLKEVGVDYLQIESREVKSRWFHGSNDTDLFVWTDERANVIKQQLTFCGQVVEWNVVDGLKTGVIIEEEIAGHGIAPSEVIRFDVLPQGAAVEVAVKLIRSVEQLESAARGILIKNLRAPKKMTDMSNQDILKKFGDARMSMSRRRPRWIEKLMRFFRLKP